MTMTNERSECSETTNQDEYNGWPNRETWAASLHLSNDFGLYEMVNRWANDARRVAVEFKDRNPGAEERYGWNLDRATITELADMLRDYIDGLRADMGDPYYNRVNETEATMVLEIGSEWRVDWRAVASAWLEGFEFDSDAGLDTFGDIGGEL